MSAECQIIVGDALSELRKLDAASVQTCITSPPYYGLRDYGTGEWEGGDPSCDHKHGGVSTWGEDSTGSSTLESRPNNDSHQLEGWKNGVCGKCGATRIDNQIGLEPTPDAYVAKLVEVFAEVKRVLRDDGTLWLNMGDSYAVANSRKAGLNHEHAADHTNAAFRNERYTEVATISAQVAGVKPKDLLGIPWMLAFALRADGWYLRSEIIWAKPNPMPESVTDRPTKAHEQVFLLSKSRSYYYDAEAIREDWTCDRDDMRSKGVRTGSAYLQQTAIVDNSAKPPRRRSKMPDGWDTGQGGHGAFHRNGRESGASSEIAYGRNKRSVWTIATQPYPEAHFATFPPKLVEPMVLAGSRHVDATVEPERILTPTGERNGDDPTMLTGRKGMNRPRDDDGGSRPITVAEQRAYARQLSESPAREMMEREAGPAFAHYLRTDASGARPIPPNLLSSWLERRLLVRVPPPLPQPIEPSQATVLDPFAGSGTTLEVAIGLGRSAIGIELSEDYAELARRRLACVTPAMFA